MKILLPDAKHYKAKAASNKYPSSVHQTGLDMRRIALQQRALSHLKACGKLKVDRVIFKAKLGKFAAE